MGLKRIPLFIEGCDNFLDHCVVVHGCASTLQQPFLSCSCTSARAVILHNYVSDQLVQRVSISRSVWSTRAEGLIRSEYARKGYRIRYICSDRA